MACALALGACTTGSGGANTLSSSGSGEGSESGERFDFAGGDADNQDCDGAGNGGGNGSGDYDFINLWVSNSPDGTVSKIDTRKREEVARYRTGPGDDDPSRTSVNLLGDMVVVNRAGSITKILGGATECPDLNDTPGIQTSTGPDDVLAWGEDDCVVWHQELTGSTGNANQWGPRPVAWEGAEIDPTSCTANPRVWVGWYDQPNNEGEFRRLEGSTGKTLDEVTIPWSDAGWGPYGGAVNKQGDFWAIGWQVGPLVRIHEDDASFDRYEVPDHPSGVVWTYGMALDPSGRPWISSAGAVLTFDPETEEFGWIDTGNVMMRGMGADEVGNLWIAVEEDAFENCALAVVDYENDQLLAANIALPGCSEPVGVSADADGTVWVVDQGAELAFSVDPDTYEATPAVGGLILPYTYSDMTGAGLDLVVHPPEG